MKDAIFVKEVFHMRRLAVRALAYVAFLIATALPFLVVEVLPKTPAIILTLGVIAGFLALIYKDSSFGRGRARWRLILG